VIRDTGYKRSKRNPWNFIAKAQTKMPADHEDVLRTLGQVIRQARKGKKMTQEDLSKLARVNLKRRTLNYLSGSSRSDLASVL